MLVDLPAWFQGPTCPTSIAREEFLRDNPDLRDGFSMDDTRAEKIADGVYLSHINFESMDLHGSGIKFDDSPFGFKHIAGENEDDRMQRVADHFSDENRVDDYGVCDHYQQVLDRWPSLVSDPDRNFILRVSEITKDDCPDWRWHKWGPYIGTQEPASEHIGDDPLIERVFVYRIVEILDVPAVV